MATKLPADLKLNPIDAEGRNLSEWLTTFHLASVVLDPYTNESSWILKTAVRVLEGFRGADVRVNFIVTADIDDTRTFMGPLQERFLIFSDPDRSVVNAMGIQTTPAFAFIRADSEVIEVAEGWDPPAWRAVAREIAQITSWKSPLIPVPSDPHPFVGAPAAG